MLEDYQQRSFAAQNIRHDVYSKGDGPATIVIIQELPGIGPQTVSLAEHFHRQGFKVVLPHLFGPLGRVSLLGNTVRVFCMRREFKLFEKQQSSPIVDWLRALCQDLRDGADNAPIGVIGMCLTGNFAISLIADDAVLAAVASQPSMPLNDQTALHMSDDDIAASRSALESKGPMLALRFEGDKLCQGAKFKAIEAAFNDDQERIRCVTLPGPGHSVLTLDLIKGGEPAQEALQEVSTYFQTALKPN